MEYLKYLPGIMAILARHPNLVKAVSESLPDLHNISRRFEPEVPELQLMISEVEALARQFGPPPVIAGR